MSQKKYLRLSGLDNAGEFFPREECSVGDCLKARFGSGMAFWAAAVVAVLLLASQAGSETLYSSTSDVLSLSGESQFRATIFDSPTVWLVEFYQSSCGHCRQYAPVFAAHASDVKGTAMLPDFNLLALLLTEILVLRM